VPLVLQHRGPRFPSNFLSILPPLPPGISDEAIKLTQGQPGLFVMTCPMARADWVQTDKKVRNPYMGKVMLECGGLKK
jgi:hypothetical protein